MSEYTDEVVSLVALLDAGDLGEARLCAIRLLRHADVIDLVQEGRGDDAVTAYDQWERIRGRPTPDRRAITPPRPHGLLRLVPRGTP